MGKAVLILNTSEGKLGDHETGVWLEETATPYYTFKEAGLDVTLASTKGGPVPIDAGSITGDFFTEASKKFLHDGAAMGEFCHTKKLADVDLDKFDCLFLAGGHGTCVDFATSADVKSACEKMYASKLLAAVCHGPVALAQCKKPDGEDLVKGLKVCGFTDSEEKMTPFASLVPFLTEKTFREQGADFQGAAEWHCNVQKDGNLITGQNPQSSEAVAKAIVEALA